LPMREASRKVRQAAFRVIQQRPRKRADVGGHVQKTRRQHGVQRVAGNLVIQRNPQCLYACKGVYKMVVGWATTVGTGNGKNKGLVVGECNKQGANGGVEVQGGGDATRQEVAEWHAVVCRAWPGGVAYRARSL